VALSRRSILKGLGWATAGLVVTAGGAYGVSRRLALPYRGAPTSADASAWLRLTPEGLIEIVMPRAELGQGIAVSFRQVVAEETGFPLERIRALLPRTDLLPPARATVGSDSVRDFAPLLASAAAALAAVLKRAGVVDGKAPPAGFDALAASPRLIDAAAIGKAVPVSLKPGAKWMVGTEPPTDAICAIVTGNEQLYADDVRLPGMVFGAVLRSPRLGATLSSVDDAKARTLPGYLGLHRLGEAVLVAAQSRSALERVLAALTSKWSGGLSDDANLGLAIDIDHGLSQGVLEHVRSDARFTETEAFDLDLRFEVPLAAHACMEPRTAVARFDEGGRLEVWTGTQDVTFVRAALAQHLGLSRDLVTVIGCRVGGGFGGKTLCNVELEAALLARALGCPVKVQWTRLDEFREAFHRPPSSHRIRARLASDGTLDCWHHAFRSGHVMFTSAAMGPVLQFATSFVGDPGVLRGAIPPYAVARSRVEFEDVRLPVHTGPWRGLGAGPNIWAVETAIDQLARLRNEDPIAFRKRLVAPQWPRLGRALDRVAALAGWPALRSSPTRGYGVACGVYKEMSYAAVVAEVTREGERMRVTRLWCAHDCGLMLNPGQVRAQVEGNLVWGIGMALHESLTLAEGTLAQTSFADYPLPRFSDVPEMTIELIDEGEAPTGAAETAIVAAAPAITNAIAAMTGRPVLELPWRPDRYSGCNAFQTRFLNP
jgi:CO/xanthine dehydrogenase Mo-binding subunit